MGQTVKIVSVDKSLQDYDAELFTIRNVQYSGHVNFSWCLGLFRNTWTRFVRTESSISSKIPVYIANVLRQSVFTTREIDVHSLDAWRILISHRSSRNASMHGHAAAFHTECCALHRVVITDIHHMVLETSLLRDIEYRYLCYIWLPSLFNKVLFKIF